MESAEMESTTLSYLSPSPPPAFITHSHHDQTSLSHHPPAPNLMDNQLQPINERTSTRIITRFQQMLSTLHPPPSGPPQSTQIHKEYRYKIHCLEYHKDTVLCVAKCQFIDAQRNVKEYIFSGSQDSSIGVWNTATFQLEGTLLGHSRSILNLYVIKQSALTPLLLSTSRDNCICIWDISSLSLLFRITGLPSLVYDIEVLSFPNHGGYYLYGCCQDTNIFVVCISMLPFLMERQYEKMKMERMHQQQMNAFKARSRSNSKRKGHDIPSVMTPNLEVDHLRDLLLLKRPSILSPKGFKRPWLHPDDDGMKPLNSTSSVSVNSVDHNAESNVGDKAENASSPMTPSKMISVKMNFKLPETTNAIREIIRTDPAVVFLSKSITDIMSIYKELMIDDDDGNGDDEDEDGDSDDIHDDDDDDNGKENESEFVVHRVFRGCHHGFIFVMKQLRNEYKLITAGSDAVIKLWDASSGATSLQILTVISGHNHSVIDLDLLGADHLITASRDETIKVWNIANVQKPHTRYTMNGHESQLTAVQVIGGGGGGNGGNGGNGHDHVPSLIVSASRNGMVKFWDGRTFQCIETYRLCAKQTNHDQEERQNKEDTDGHGMHIVDGMGKPWTCDSDQMERDKPNCVMRFEFMAPSWLLLCDTASRIEIWNITPILKKYAMLHPSSSSMSTLAPSPRPMTITTKLEHKHKDKHNRKGMVINKDSKSIQSRSSSFTSSVTLQHLLNALDLSEYAARFEAERVDLETLSYLGDTDLIQMNIPLGPRRKIMSHIRSLNAFTNHNNSNSNSNGNRNGIGNGNGYSLRIEDEEDDHELVTANLNHFVRDDSYRIISDLAQFIAFKSISSRMEYRTECWNAAHFIQNKCEEFGAETRLVQGVVGKNPVVLAKFSNLNDQRFHDQRSSSLKVEDQQQRVRIVMYGHYDVVDINNESGWTSPPFTLTGKNGYLYGRGTTDNKGPIIVFLHAIRELLEEMENERGKGHGHGHDGNDGGNDEEEKHQQKLSMADVPLEIVMVIEGQEEHDWNGGGLKEVVERNMDWLAKPTLIICSNSYWLGDTVPAIIYGMRGHLQICVTVTGSIQDCHSGVHGGAFSEPMVDLIAILATLSDPSDGRVRIPGFYNDILPLREDEGALYDEIVRTFTVKDYLKSIGYLMMDDEHHHHQQHHDHDHDEHDDAAMNSKEFGPKQMAQSKLLLMKKWRSPSLSVHNLQQSSNECTVISRSASATLSIRTVPDQDNMNIINLCRDYLKKEFGKLTTMNTLSFEVNNIGPHWLADYNHYVFKCAEKAIVEHWNVDKPYYIREGGTIPCVNYLHHKLKAPLLQFPLGQSSDRAHLENERIRLQNLSKGKDVIKSCLMNVIYHHVHLQSE